MNEEVVVSDSSKELLRMLKQPFTVNEISKLTKQPIKELEVLLRSFMAEGFVASFKGKYLITDKGRLAINEEAMQYN